MNYGEGDVCVIDLASQKVTARYKAGQTPFGGGLRFPGGRPTMRQ
jgi:YVTN family beta-propeller protein